MAFSFKGYYTGSVFLLSAADRETFKTLFCEGLSTEQNFNFFHIPCSTSATYRINGNKISNFCPE